jgi:hypothetical protein
VDLANSSIVLLYPVRRKFYVFEIKGVKEQIEIMEKPISEGN